MRMFTQPQPHQLAHAPSSPGHPEEMPSPRGGGDLAPIPSFPLPSSPQSPVASGQSLAAKLLPDLLDPTNTPVQICKMHDITLTDLAAIVESTAYRQAAEHIKTINAARTPVIDSSDELQAHALQRTIAQDAYLAAADMDQATTSTNPKLATIRARFLETARKANRSIAGCLHSPQRGAVVPSNQPSTSSLLPRASGCPYSPSPAQCGQSSDRSRTARLRREYAHPDRVKDAPSPAPLGKVPTKSAEGLFFPWWRVANPNPLPKNLSTNTTQPFDTMFGVWYSRPAGPASSTAPGRIVG